jgi:nitronate monooxygenase
MQTLRTNLCDLLGIEYPIVQSGMNGVAGPELVAEVCRAGGLGILAALRLTPDALRTQIRRIRELTDRPFGVNQWLHPDVRRPVDPAAVDSSVVADVQRTLNTFRARLGVTPADARPAQFPAFVDHSFEVIIEERVPVWSIGLGNPEPALVDRCHAAGILVMTMVTSVEDATAAAAAGVDIVVAQGAEAGGHRSIWRRGNDGPRPGIGTMVLVPQVVDAIDQPVLAAGGIADGRGLAAALVLGASGAMLGTRFIAAREAIAPAFFKSSVIAAGSGDTVVSTAFTGLPMRSLRNQFATDYESSGAPTLPAMLQANAADDIYKAAAQAGNRDYFPMPAGQSAGLISDMPGAADIVRSIVDEARTALDRLPRPR